MEIKILFKCWGRIRWLDKNDLSNFFYVPVENALFRWASSQGGAILCFKRGIQKSLKRRSPKNYPFKLAHIFLDEAEIQEVRRIKAPAIQKPIQKQLELFKRTSR